MPEMSGVEVREKLKNNPRTLNIPVIMQSAFPTAEGMGKALRIGASDWFLGTPAQDKLIRDITFNLKFNEISRL